MKKCQTIKEMKIFPELESASISLNKRRITADEKRQSEIEQ